MENGEERNESNSEIVPNGLTYDQKQIFLAFQHRVQEELINAKKLGEQEEHLKTWLDCSPDCPCLHRYLRAREWNLDAAFKMISKSVEWRNEYKPHLIPLEEIQPILDLGSLYRNGTDRLGRPLLYIKPSVYNPYPWELRIRGLVYVLEKTISSMSPGVETMVWVMDWTGYSNREKRSEGGGKVAQNSLQILQNQYPERLGNAFILNSPWWMSFLWSLLSPFMSSSTKSKIKWFYGDKEKLHEQLSPYIDDEELETVDFWNHPLLPTLSLKLSLESDAFSVYGGKRPVGAAEALEKDDQETVKEREEKNKEDDKGKGKDKKSEKVKSK